MTLPQVYRLFEYWRRFPPEHEMLAILARAQTTWEPGSAPMTQEEHRKSLEARWKAGAMNIAQLYKAMGGSLSGSNGGKPMTGADLPGIGPFPGAN